MTGFTERPGMFDDEALAHNMSNVVEAVGVFAEDLEAGFKLHFGTTGTAEGDGQQP